MSRGEPLPGAPSHTQLLTEEVKVPTFEEFSKEWYETYVKIVNKPSEQYTKEGVLRVHLLPFFGNTPIDKINVRQIDQFKSSKVKANLNPKTINNFLAILRKCLQSAMDWGMLSTVPKMQKLREGAGRIDFLSPVESAQLLTDTAYPVINGMTLMGLRTGMRFGELIGLDWSDVDLQKKRINVTRNKVMGKVGTPKNGKTRSIDISSDLHAYLIRQPRKIGSVFNLEDGRELTHHLALNALKRSCERVGVRKISWHVLRHTTASHLVSEGVPLNVVKELLGHSSILMTMKYAHLAPSAIKDAVELFSKIEQRELNKVGTETALT